MSVTRQKQQHYYSLNKLYPLLVVSGSFHQLTCFDTLKQLRNKSSNSLVLNFSLTLRSLMWIKLWGKTAGEFQPLSILHIYVYGTSALSHWHVLTFARGDRVPFMIWRTGKRLFARGWYVSITLWRPFAVTVSFSTQPHTHTQPLSDNAPNIRWGERESWQKRDCLTLLFAFVSSLFFTNKGFLINWKGPPP